MTETTQVSEMIAEYLQGFAAANQTEEINLLVLYAGGAEAELAAMEQLCDAGACIGHAYFVDLYTPDAARAVCAAAAGLARSVLTGTFGDALRFLETLRDEDVARTACIALHPQHGTFGDHINGPAVTRAFLQLNGSEELLRELVQDTKLSNVQATNMLKQVEAGSANRDTASVVHMACQRMTMYREAGAFYRVWLWACKMSVAVFWRNGKQFFIDGPMIDSELDDTVLFMRHVSRAFSRW